MHRFWFRSICKSRSKIQWSKWWPYSCLYHQLVGNDRNLSWTCTNDKFDQNIEQDQRWFAKWINKNSTIMLIYCLAENKYKMTTRTKHGQNDTHVYTVSPLRKRWEKEWKKMRQNQRHLLVCLSWEQRFEFTMNVWVISLQTFPNDDRCVLSWISNGRALGTKDSQCWINCFCAFSIDKCSTYHWYNVNTCSKKPSWIDWGKSHSEHIFTIRYRFTAIDASVHETMERSVDVQWQQWAHVQSPDTSTNHR